MNNKFKSCICTLTACVTAVTGLAFSSAEEKNDKKVSIMALGDSITDGYYGTDGYRKYLYHDLETAGYTNIDMVGAKMGMSSFTDGSGNTFQYDGDHSGYSGYAIQHITGTEERQGILEMVQSTDMIATCNPDVVLLQIGTNDILSNYNDGITDRLENLINVILEDMNDSTDVIYVSTIPYMDVAEVYDWFWAYGDLKWQNTQEDFIKIINGYTDSYNESIKTLTTKMKSEGKPVRLADINGIVNPDTDLKDGVHPNEEGYAKMGAYWSSTLINGYLSSEPIKPTEPVTTEPATTEPVTTEPVTTEPATTEPTTTQTETTTVTTTVTSIVTDVTETTVSETTTTDVQTTETSVETTDITTDITTVTTEVPVTTQPEEQLKGDINDDKAVNITDLVLINKYLIRADVLTEEQLVRADLVNDGKINIFDSICLRRLIINE